jgi:hypothetical protein
MLNIISLFCYTLAIVSRFSSVPPISDPRDPTPADIDCADITGARGPRPGSQAWLVNFAALLGDREQFVEVALYTQSLISTDHQRYTSARAQADYMRRFVRGRIPVGYPSDHTISTAFECLYHVNVTFRDDYDSRLRAGALD